MALSYYKEFKFLQSMHNEVMGQFLLAYSRQKSTQFMMSKSFNMTDYEVIAKKMFYKNNLKKMVERTLKNPSISDFNGWSNPKSDEIKKKGQKSGSDSVEIIKKESASVSSPNSDENLKKLQKKIFIRSSQEILQKSQKDPSPPIFKVKKIAS
jgi:hypothetical protein